MEQPELEYRAKLTELIMADETSLELIEKFKTGGRNDRTYPHAYANDLVYKNIKTRVLGKQKLPWKKVPIDQIKKVATQLLNESTRLLNSK